MNGQDLSKTLKSRVYYIIFANFKAYLKGEIINDLYLNGVRKGYENVEYTTDENDVRTRLSVW
ncbi:DUF2691 family protein [Paenibacillus agri]|uniref:DUF2691 family protein n=1 Tax=Paenibacillus agri TaxID=2744309 RepID=A0A850EKD1_9BACL|nr:DUF2691 family protein [Paenibacillus agri]NUU59907.1 DUF2691 family protein [Paenibacillus agri]